MDQDWTSNAESYDNYFFDDQFLTNFFDGDAQEPTNATAVSSLDAFDFGVRKDKEGRASIENELDNSYYSSPLARTSLAQDQLSKTGRIHDMGVVVPTSTPLLSMDAQLSFAPRSSSTAVSGRAQGSSRGISQEFPGSYNPGQSSTAVAPVQLSYNNSQLGEIEASVAPAPKVRKTRKRKAVSAEEKDRKKTAFLARNREAAKKCRAKRKVQQENIQDKSQRLNRYNMQCKAELIQLQTMKENLMLELLPLQAIPGVADEIRSINAGQAQRPPMFFVNDSLALSPLSEMDASHLSQPLSRRESIDSYSARRASGGSEMSRSNSMTSGFSEQQIHPQFLASQDMGTSARQPQPLDTMFVHQDLEQTSNNSTPSAGRSSSRNSGRDSGIESISPTTPKSHSSNLPDEAIIVDAPTPTKRIDPALLDEPVDYFSKQAGSEQAFRPLVDPSEYLRAHAISEGQVWT